MSKITPSTSTVFLGPGWQSCSLACSCMFGGFIYRAGATVNEPVIQASNRMVFDWFIFRWGPNGFNQMNAPFSAGQPYPLRYLLDLNCPRKANGGR